MKSISTDLLHCVSGVPIEQPRSTSKVTIKADEVVTSAAPDAVADGWGFAGGDRVPCQGRRGCWFLVEVPDPGMYPGDRQHWIPVSTTRSELANADRACHLSLATH